MLLCCIIPSSSGKTNASSRRSKKDFWHRCRGGLRSSQDIPSTHHKLISLAFTLFAICLSFSSPPLHPCHFIRPLFPFASFSLASCLLVCWIACSSRWLKILPNCVTSPIPTIMLFLALRLLLLPIMNLVKSILLC